MHSTTQHLSGDIADGDSRPRSHGARREMQAYAAGGGWAVDRRVRSADLARRFCCLRAGEFPMVMIGGSSFFSTPSPSLARCGRVKHFFFSLSPAGMNFFLREHTTFRTLDHHLTHLLWDRTHPSSTICVTLAPPRASFSAMCDGSQFGDLS